MSTIRADNISTVAGVSAPMLDAVQGSARAWVNFNGTGVVAVRAQYNVSSITDNGVGDYTVNFTNAMPNADYSWSGSSGGGFAATDVSLRGFWETNTTVRTVSLLRIRSQAVNSTSQGAEDGLVCCVAVFGA